MAFFVGTVNYYPGLFPPPTEASRGSMLINNGNGTAFWAYPGNSQSAPSGTLQNRSYLTHGYMTGGYKDGIAWRSMNKTWHSTDTTIYCGEQLNNASAYSGGSFSDYYGYVHGAGGGYATASARTVSYNLATGIQRSNGALPSGANPGGPFGYQGNDPGGAGIPYGTNGSVVGVGSWELSVARTYFAAAVNQIGQTAYITGGPESTNCDKFHFPTEIMYTTTSPGFAGTHCTASHGELRSYWSIAGNMRYQTYATDAWAVWTPGTAASPDGVCKILSTKLGYHYVGSGANVTTPGQKFSDSTGSTLSTTITKPSAYGEENMQMGQNWGYCLGAYNGQQNNYTVKYNYLTDVLSVMGVATQPKGHAGQSSALCSSAAASVVMNNY